MTAQERRQAVLAALDEREWQTAAQVADLVGECDGRSVALTLQLLADDGLVAITYPTARSRKAAYRLTAGRDAKGE